MGSISVYDCGTFLGSGCVQITIIVVLIFSFPGETINAAVINAVQDNFVRHGESRTVQDFTTDLLVKQSEGPVNRRVAYIGFDLSAENIPGELNVEDVNFKLTFDRYADGGAVNSEARTFDVFALTNESLDTWSQQTIAWSNAPGNNPSNNNFLPGDTTLVSGFVLPPAPNAQTTFSIQSVALRM